MSFSFIAERLLMARLPGRLVASTAIETGIWPGVPDRDSGPTTAIYRKHADGDLAAPGAKRFSHFYSGRSAVGRRAERKSGRNISDCCLPCARRAAGCAHASGATGGHAQVVGGKS